MKKLLLILVSFLNPINLSAPMIETEDPIPSQSQVSEDLGKVHEEEINQKKQEIEQIKDSKQQLINRLLKKHATEAQQEAVKEEELKETIKQKEKELSKLTSKKKQQGTFTKLVDQGKEKLKNATEKYNIDISTETTDDKIKRLTNEIEEANQQLKKSQRLRNSTMEGITQMQETIENNEPLISLQAAHDTETSAFSKQGTSKNKPATDSQLSTLNKARSRLYRAQLDSGQIKLTDREPIHQVENDIQDDLKKKRISFNEANSAFSETNASIEEMEISLKKMEKNKVEIGKLLDSKNMYLPKTIKSMNSEIKAAKDKLQSKIEKEKEIKERNKKQAAKEQAAKKAAEEQAIKEKRIETTAKHKFNKANDTINDPKTKLKSMIKALNDMQETIQNIPEKEKTAAQEKITTAKNKINKIKKEQQDAIDQAAQGATRRKNFEKIRKDTTKNRSKNMEKSDLPDNQSDNDSVGHQDSNDSFNSDKIGKTEKKGLAQRFKEWLASKFDFVKKMVAKDNLENNPEQAKTQLDQLIRQAKQDYESKIEKLEIIKSPTKDQEKQIQKYGKQLKELAKGYRNIFYEDLSRQKKAKKPLSTGQFKLFGEIKNATDLNDFINNKEKKFGITVNT